MSSFWSRAAALKAWLAPPRQIEFPRQGFAFAVACSTGLYLCSRRRWHRLFHGVHTGISFADGAMLVFQTGPSRGRIRRVDQSGRCTTVAENLPAIPHLLDCWEGRLYAAGAEVIRVFELQSFEETDVLGPVPEPGGSVCSLNGLAFHSGQTLVLCQTGRTSSIVVGDRAFGPQRSIALDADNAHSLAFLGDRLLICDTGGRRLIDLDGPLARFDGAPRGLAVTDDTVAVGLGDGRGGRLVFLDHRFAVTGTLTLPGEVLEVRPLFFQP